MTNCRVVPNDAPVGVFPGMQTGKQVDPEVDKQRSGKTEMRRLLRIVASIVLGFLLMAPLATLFEAMNWPVFHRWGLAHGSFIIAWPVLTLIAYGLLALLGQAVQSYKRRRVSRSASGPR